ncbi:MAG: bifunctional diaminohydroxyphosphoribosylaminopyrimidine deaminase/5-amino-6-(5-phosphoribosylamino)uracil reductase RibD [Firmicutes bacterium]|nr:bifunctional diaminohydroxyphosphoribosylaminopyrimidine deaminase/5-amino-6-(5-phosphoribosylamino)uracil reductase RibD [Bacillota bacterium]
MHNDEHWMRQALDLAARARGRTSPNPLVGAVIVKDGRMVGSGYHQRAGGPHAEVLALEQAGAASQGADIYVTLEPCAHYGRTPPCTEALISAGIRRVVIAMIDPNPLTSGKGVARLRQDGVIVEEGLLEGEAQALNAPYITYMTKKRPYVLWKVAATLDGKSATRIGASKWISSPQARALVHQKRQEMDAIMVGVGTVLADDPLLTARPEGCDPAHIEQPVRIIVDSKLRIPLRARCIQPDNPGRTIVATTDDAPPVKAELLRQRGVDVWSGPACDGRVDVKALLSDLAQLEITSVLLEGGSTLAGTLFDLRLIDACMVFVAPVIFGGTEALPVLGGFGVDHPSSAPRLHGPKWLQVGPDLMVEGTLKWPEKQGDACVHGTC